ncbi:hypothetical protein LTS07_009225 [Exophiala sideris]|uniref:Uncharacterized protein n=1 Tax=Exophiala sideris TaxID=1016849 RepID=A0ABR0J0U1_9EURO|nr:hypothetical protein LTS07_009225 [Exophiala sideris]KAK5029716.1 hypothetical protein LTR13_008636 [Exophiala sideris]KAK5053506.1 hypothetical protein LTR69_009464 [Exophiala sideris]KAK5179264.1 hypothetical protein LTR44_008418 [Eurotiomycetes sp. CCFEE 6388]
MATKKLLKLVLTAIASSTAVAVALPQISGSDPDLIGVILTNGAREGKPIFKEYDPSLPVPFHTCPRDFLAALANFSEFCGWDGRTLHKCKSDATANIPSLQECCGHWYGPGDYGPEDRDLYMDEPISDIRLGKTVVIAKDSDGFNTKLKACGPWKPASEMQYAYYMVNLEKFV